MSCGICCSESRFCRDCCCILCCKIIDTTVESYSYIKCKEVVGDGYICGHLSHIKCGLKSYTAGTVGGSIGLDAEYYCRRCDARTDLVSHVERFLQSCQSADCQDDVEEILNLGLCILRGSHKMRAKELLRHIELSIEKVKLVFSTNTKYCNILCCSGTLPYYLTLNACFRLKLGLAWKRFGRWRKIAQQIALVIFLQIQ